VAGSPTARGLISYSAHVRKPRRRASSDRVRSRSSAAASTLSPKPAKYASNTLARVAAFWQWEVTFVIASWPMGTLYLLFRQNAPDPSWLVQIDFMLSVRPARSASSRWRYPLPFSPFWTSAANF